VATAGDSPNAEDTFAKLLRAHASLRGTRPAFRLKDLGLWQTWTWAQVYEETRAIAQGLVWLGLKRSQTIAIVGANRPRLYWSITAAQMIGAVPVPVYADAVAEEIAAVLAHSEAAIIIVQDQEQVDKILSVRDRLPKLTHLLHDETRGLNDYDEPASRRSPRSPRKAAPRSPIPLWRENSIAALTPAGARIPRLYFTPPAPPAAPRASC
jgi:long-chain acyl-CoA synthetase